MERQSQQEDPSGKDSSTTNATASTFSAHQHRRQSFEYGRRLSSASASDYLPSFSWHHSIPGPDIHRSSQAQAAVGWRDSLVSGFSPSIIQPTHFNTPAEPEPFDDTSGVDLSPADSYSSASRAMPPPRPPTQTSTSQNTMPANIIDLTEDDEAPTSNSDNLQTHQTASRRRHERQNRAVPRPSANPEIIDLESPERGHLIPPPFLEPDAAPGRHHQENHSWDPDLEIIGHAIHNSVPRLSSQIPISRWPNVMQVGLAQQLIRLQSHRHAPPRQAPHHGHSRTTLGTSAIRPGPRLPSRVMRYFSGQIATATRMPGLLNYNRPAFDLSQHDGSPDFAATHAEAALARVPTSTPQIEPLAAPRHGFTRAPTTDEDAVPVCPNCERELCSGDSEDRRQVYAVKGCGHVYCGECALNRHKNSIIRKKGKERRRCEPLAGDSAVGAATTDTFAQCVVAGCGQTTRTKQSMVQIFL